MYSIEEFAKMINVTQQTLRNWDKNGKLKPIVLKSGHRRYTLDHYKQIKNIKNIEKINVIYCRESTKQQKTSLERQEELCKNFCISNGIKIDKVISEYGSALNYKRKGFLELINLIINDRIDTLIIFYKDRLVRFGFDLIEELIKQNNINLIIIDNSESNKTKEKEFADDLISIVHYFSMKLYGSKNYKNKIKEAEQCLKNIKEEIL